MSIWQKDVEAFQRQFQYQPHWQVRAPGRVNLIGEHTDYNEGFVLPVAINRYVRITGCPRDDRQVRIFSINYNALCSFHLDDLKKTGAGWFEYIRGVAATLAEDGFRLSGWDGVVSGDIPLGAGLSSSAALTVASTRAFAAAGKLQLSPEQMAKTAQKAENRWMGVNCGIMDQMISASGRKGYAVLLDCRTLETRPVPLPENTIIMVVDTRTRRELVDSAYNERRNQCDQAAKLLGVSSLRDVSLSAFENSTGIPAGKIRKRARHVITENERTLLAVESMQRNDPVALGRLMVACHKSLRDDFEVSCPELNAAVECAMAVGGCYGARMTGAGFGGCAVALIAARAAEAFVAAVPPCFIQNTGGSCLVYPCRSVDGVTLYNL